jgi:hypothetical protein
MEMIVIGMGRIAPIAGINYMLTRGRLTAINDIGLFLYKSYRCRMRINKYSFDNLVA